MKDTRIKDDMRCYWCGQFLSKETREATIREPNVFYCPKCYEKGCEMEYEAMGLYDKNY